MRQEDVGRERSRVPDAGGGVDGAGNDPAAVRAEGQHEEARGVAPKGEDLAAGGRVPELDRPVEAGGGDPAAVGTESDTDHLGGVADQRPEHQAGRRVQDLDRAVRIRLAAIAHRGAAGTDPDAGDELAVGASHGPRRDQTWERGRREVFGPELAGVDPGQRRVLFPGARVPALRGFARDLICERSGDDTTPVAAIPQAAHPAGVALEDDRGACPPVPDLHRALQSARGQLAAVGREGDGLHEVGVTVEHADRAAGGDLPQPDTPVFARRGEGTAVGAEGQVEDEPLMAEDR